jgi:integrase
VPLSDLAMDIIAGLPRFSSPYLFPALQRGRGYATGFDRPKQACDRLCPDVVDWRFHDLRRTAASQMASLGVRPDVIGRILNHAPTTIAARVYDRYSYGPEMRHGLDAWARKLTSIVGLAPTTGVVDLAEKRAKRVGQ